MTARRTQHRKKTVNEALSAAAGLFRTHKQLAEAAGTTQQQISRILSGERTISPQLALGIHRATQGRVSADQLRPDLWSRPEHVPIGRRA